MTAIEVLTHRKLVSDRPKRRLPASLRKIGRLMHTLYLQRIKGFKVPDTPHFDGDSTPYFVERLSVAKLYLEYGTGGSSVLASKMGKSIVSVDSDPFFLEAVKEKIGITVDGKGDATQTFIYIDIGLTERWGVPVCTRPTPRRLAAWRSYFTAPWSGAGGNGVGGRFLPDLILVDGRFRVACALTTILNLSDQRNWEILFDDYLGRSHYAIVEEFASLERMVGRMAVFKPKERIDVDSLRRTLEAYASDWR